MPSDNAFGTVVMCSPLQPTHSHAIANIERGLPSGGRNIRLQCLYRLHEEEQRVLAFIGLTFRRCTLARAVPLLRITSWLTSHRLRCGLRGCLFLLLHQLIQACVEPIRDQSSEPAPYVQKGVRHADNQGDHGKHSHKA